RARSVGCSPRKGGGVTFWHFTGSALEFTTALCVARLVLSRLPSQRVALSTGLGGASGLMVRDSDGGLLFATVDIEGDTMEVSRAVSNRLFLSRDGVLS
ncbi:hypothetical protein LINPERHAP1_LOCUS31281, partial [Linum perenne]